ncbi:MAG: hypothetical protein COA69_06565 [Robiginitomaculum sp.]|nr:MAG: hypothetical protein COA69_06565 [Robiginitomaculum sp.]
MDVSPAHVLDHYPPTLKARLRAVRSLIFELAQNDEEIGEIVESLKWGQLNFATYRPKSGTPLRIGANADTGTYSLYVSCSTKLIANFRDIHPDMFAYHGNREIRLCADTPLPEVELTLFINAALLYYAKPPKFQ